LWITVLNGRVFELDRGTGVLSGPLATIPVVLGGEGGLLMIVFHPAFSENGRLFVYRSVGPGRTVNRVTEYTCDPASPGTIPLETEREILVTGDTGLHNGGWMGFDATGMLMVAVGDGAFSPQNAQDVSVNLRGKILRIDVDGDDFPGDASKNYAIPADNPFASGPGLDEIWMYGVRNPWRCWIDAETNDLWIADVGSLLAGEISRIGGGGGGGGGGANLDWPCHEGWLSNPRGLCEPDPPVNIEPIAALTPRDGAATTGGVVYRGAAMSRCVGSYFFADYRVSRLFTIAEGRPGFRTIGRLPPVAATFQGLTTFGVDGRGEMYGGDARGVIHAIVCGADFNRDGFTDTADAEAFTRAFVEGGEPTADVNGDSFVDHFDYFDFVDAFELGC
jgi:glucose/arabinose dehydrogenase